MTSGSFRSVSRSRDRRESQSARLRVLASQSEASFGLLRNVFAQPRPRAVRPHGGKRQFHPAECTAVRRAVLIPRRQPPGVLGARVAGPFFEIGTPNERRALTTRSPVSRIPLRTGERPRRG